MATLIKDMLFHRRQYIIEKVKAPLQKAIETLSSSRTNLYNRVRLVMEIIKLARKYPEPTRRNLVFHNSQIRLEVKEEFFRNFNNPGREPLLQAAFRVLIDECEHDGFYEFVHDWYITELLKRGWRPAKRGFPMYRYWKGRLPADYCMESDPKWISYWLERKNDVTLVEKELVNK